MYQRNPHVLHSVNVSELPQRHRNLFAFSSISFIFLISSDSIFLSMILSISSTELFPKTLDRGSPVPRNPPEMRESSELPNHNIKKPFVISPFWTGELGELKDCSHYKAHLHHLRLKENRVRDIFPDLCY